MSNLDLPTPLAPLLIVLLLERRVGTECRLGYQQDPRS